MSEQELRQLFKDRSDCYADTWSQDGIGAPMIEGEIIQSITEDRFIEILKEAKLIKKEMDKNNIETPKRKYCYDEDQCFNINCTTCEVANINEENKIKQEQEDIEKAAANYLERNKSTSEGVYNYSEDSIKITFIDAINWYKEYLKNK